MSLTYYPVKSSPTLKASAPFHCYPGKPKYDKGIDLSLPDLVWCSILDLMKASPLPSPINISWLFDMLESVIDDSPTRMQVKRYSEFSASWKKAFSEVIANSIGIGAALFQENYDWLVPVQLCRKPGDAPDWWPWTSATWKIEGAIEHFPKNKNKVLMPDYLLAKQVGNRLIISSMELKGKNDPIDTESLQDYERWKLQSENILILDPTQNISPTIHRKILSVGSVRPGLITGKGRELKCRWFNHAEPGMETINNGFLSFLSVMQSLWILQRLFGVTTRLPFFTEPIGLRPIRTKLRIARSPKEIPKQLGMVEYEDGFILKSTSHDPGIWRPFIRRDTIQLLDFLYEGGRDLRRHLGKIFLNDRTRLRDHFVGDPVISEILFILDNRVSNFLENNRYSAGSRGSILPIGIGIKQVT